MVKRGLGASSCSFFSRPEASTASLTPSGATNRTGKDLAAIVPLYSSLSLALQRPSLHIGRMSEKTRISRQNSRALIAIGGEDWRSFLQGLLTQDVETIQPGEA